MKKTILILLALGIGQLLSAQAVMLPPDSSFNEAGHLLIDEHLNFIPYAQCLQEDNKILVAAYGHDENDQHLDGFVARINTDGKLDETFAENGILRIDIDGTDDAVQDIAITQDEKILILLASNYRTILIRLHADGSYDSSFGNSGIQLVQTYSSELPAKMLAQPDGRIIVLGKAPMGVMKGTVRRLLPDGAPDNSFGDDGLVILSVGTSPTELKACELNQEGDLIIAGNYGTGPTGGFVVFQLTTEGLPDSDFSQDGTVIKPLGNNFGATLAWDLAVAEDGHIYVAGQSPASVQSALTVIALKENGSLEIGFGGLGVKKITVSPYAVVNSIKIQPDGKLLLGGYSFTSESKASFVYARLLQNGTLDPQFGLSSGTLIASLNSVYELEVLVDMDFDQNSRLVSTVWLANTVDLPSTAYEYTMVFRSLMDFVVATQDAQQWISSPRLYPNPITSDHLDISFNLPNSKSLRFSLLDAQGSLIADLGKMEAIPGENQYRFDLPPGLPKGPYYFIIQSDEGTLVRKVVR